MGKLILYRIIPIIIVRLVFLSSASNSTDHPFDDFATTVIASVHINLSVIITCLPFLKTVLDSLQTGLLASDLRTRGRTQLFDYAFDSFGTRSRKGSCVASNKRIKSQDNQYITKVASVADSNPLEGGLTGNSQERMAISHTTTFSVQYMEAGESR